MRIEKTMELTFYDELTTRADELATFITSAQIAENIRNKFKSMIKLQYNNKIVKNR